ncbi:MAG: DegT/DnrJ/EryC1/StrS family aminotransferase [Balneola sp.]
MNIQLLDLSAQYKSLETELKKAINSVLDSQNFIMGSQVKEFEKEVNEYIGSNHAFGSASGSDALLLALMAIDVEPGDYVITSPFTFFATAGAISRLGAIPIFIDIEPDSFNVDPAKVRDFLEGKDELSKKIKAPLDKIKAIIPVHLYGQMADMDVIMDIANEFDLYVIEDAAQSIGSMYKGKNAGTIGDFGCFSFFPSKNLGAYGDAGLITVKNEVLAEKVDILRLHGAKPKYHHKLVGINSRLDTIQAAVLQVKLKHLENWSNSRREIASLYNAEFEKCGLLTDSFETSNSSRVITPKETIGSLENDGKHIYHQYTIRIQKRDSLASYLNEQGIGNSVYYPVPLHMQECFSNLGYVPDDCPEALLASKQALSLPIYPELEVNQVEEVVSIIKDFLMKKG